MALLTKPFLDHNKRQMDILTPALAALYGLPTKIYYPLSNPSIYGASDNIFVYSDIPDLEGDFVFLGDWLGKRYLSDVTIDVYTGNEVYMLITGDLLIPKDSKVIVTFTTSIYAFHSEPEEVYDADKIMYHRVKLKPMEVS